MCKPFEKSKGPNAIVSEIMSAQSSLDMDPIPLDPPEKESIGRPWFLAEIDGRAKHAYEHLDSAFYKAKKLEDALKEISHKICVYGIKNKNKEVQAILADLHNDLKLAGVNG